MKYKSEIINNIIRERKRKRINKIKYIIGTVVYIASMPVFIGSVLYISNTDSNVMMLKKGNSHSSFTVQKQATFYTNGTTEDSYIVDEDGKHTYCVLSLKDKTQIKVTYDTKGNANTDDDEIIGVSIK